MVDDQDFIDRQFIDSFGKVSIEKWRPIEVVEVEKKRRNIKMGQKSLASTFDMFTDFAWYFVKAEEGTEDTQGDNKQINKVE